jgi:two-component system KDP operon response regulator KdpE
MINNKMRVLVVDDETAIRRFLRTSLTVHNYDVVEAETGNEGILQAINTHPDVIILDLALPDTNGVDVTYRLREWSNTPILILSVQDQDTDKIAALDAGADDYMTKPFSIGELLARLRVALRHTQPPDNNPVFHIKDLEVDLAARIVRLKNEVMQLTPTEYDLLRILIRHAGKVITHRQIWQEIRGNQPMESHVIRVHMSNLRRKLETDVTNPQYIMTEPGVGYRLWVDS